MSLSVAPDCDHKRDSHGVGSLAGQSASGEIPSSPSSRVVNRESRVSGLEVDNDGVVPEEVGSAVTCLQESDGVVQYYEQISLNGCRLGLQAHGSRIPANITGLQEFRRPHQGRFQIDRVEHMPYLVALRHSDQTTRPQVPSRGFLG